MQPVKREALTRDAVVAATRALIVDEGLEAVSLRRIGAALGVTAPALYAHVTDKRDLLRAVAEFGLTELMSRFRQVTDLDPVTRLRRFSRAYIDYAVENPELFKTIFLFPPELAVGQPTGEELPLATQAFELPLRAIDEAIRTGRFAPTDAATASLVLWSCTHGCADVLLFGFDFDDASRESLIASVLDTVIAGLSVEPDEG
jgi:AcrR family transcriptional regulator